MPTPAIAPVLYLSHGAPPLAEDATWTSQLAAWSAQLPKPKAILIVSAHWENAPITLGATRTVDLVYDFWGFPERYYRVTYPAPGAPQLAERVGGLLRTAGAGVHVEPERGLDHGAYVPLVQMYPDADVPVLQVSMPSLDAGELFRFGERLAPLRDEGVLIIGSGFFTHNLRAMKWSLGSTGTPPSWSSEFDHWGAQALRSGNIDELIDFQHRAPAAALAHPSIEHFAPLFVSLGAASPTTSSPQTVIDGYWYGLAKRSVQFD